LIKDWSWELKKQSFPTQLEKYFMKNDLESEGAQNGKQFPPVKKRETFAPTI